MSPLIAPLIGVVTTSRADYGIYRSVLKQIAASPELRLGLWVSGMHMSPEFGRTVSLVERDGYPIVDQIEGLLSADSEEGVAASMGLTTLRFASSLARTRPDILLVLGDRFEMHAAAMAAVPLRIPLAHIHGGEETENAIDNVFRHSLTKLSHIHFTSTQLARARVCAMGEPADRVILSGAPALDNVTQVELVSHAELSAEFGLPTEPFIIATYHPESLEPEGAIEALKRMTGALAPLNCPVVFTEANADAVGRAVNEWLRDYCARSKGAEQLVGTLGVRGYFSAMKAARLMIGNSSSGIIEAASFGLPVVNIGDRQAGRERSSNTIDVRATQESISAGIERALSAEFGAQAGEARNVYGDGGAAARIVDGLTSFIAAGAPVAKRFVLPSPPTSKDS